MSRESGIGPGASPPAWPAAAAAAARGLHDDRDVPAEQSANLIDALRSHQVERDELVLPSEIHNVARYASWQFFRAADRYFAQHLEQRATAKSQ